MAAINCFVSLRQKVKLYTVFGALKFILSNIVIKYIITNKL